MDNVTHTLTGVLLARAGLFKLSPRAVWISAIAANIPDIDVVSLFGGGDIYFMYHRWATHSIAFLPLMAVIPVLAVAGFSRARLPWFKAWLIAMIAIASHLLLDFTNPYGIRLWLPFSDALPSLDITNVVDIWVWAILIAGVAWPMLSSLVGSEIGAKNKPHAGAAIAALVMLALYDTGRSILHHRAIQTLETRIYDGAAPRQTFVFPNFANPLRWDGWVETEKSWQAIPVNLAEEFDPEPTSVTYKAAEHPAILIARRLAIFQDLSKFARTPHWRVTPASDVPDGNLVELVDLRFGRDGRSGFTATAIIDNAGHVVSSGFHF